MKTQYEEISRQLERIDFGALWPGFHPYPFALYDGAHAILDGQFMDCPGVFGQRSACLLGLRPLRADDTTGNADPGISGEVTHHS